MPRMPPQCSVTTARWRMLKTRPSGEEQLVHAKIKCLKNTSTGVLYAHAEAPPEPRLITDETEIDDKGLTVTWEVPGLNVNKQEIDHFIVTLNAFDPMPVKSNSATLLTKGQAVRSLRVRAMDRCGVKGEELVKNFVMPTAVQDIVQITALGNINPKGLQLTLTVEPTSSPRKREPPSNGAPSVLLHSM